MKKTAIFIHPPNEKEPEQYNPPGVPPELIDEIAKFWPFLVAEVPLREAIGRLIYRTALDILKGKINIEEIKDGINT